MEMIDSHVKAVFSGLVLTAPQQHRWRTPNCLTIAQLSNCAFDCDQERHIQSCPYCSMIVRQSAPQHTGKLAFWISTLVPQQRVRWAITGTSIVSVVCIIVTILTVFASREFPEGYRKTLQRRHVIATEDLKAAVRTQVAENMVSRGDGQRYKSGVTNSVRPESSNRKRVQNAQYSANVEWSFAKAFYVAGQYGGAIYWYKRALRASEEIGTAKVAVVRLHSEMAAVYFGMGDLKHCQQSVETVLAILDTMDGVDYDKLRALRDLVILARLEGNPRQALEYGVRGYKLAMRTVGKQDNYTISFDGEMGMELAALGRQRSAAEHIRRAREVLESRPKGLDDGFSAQLMERFAHLEDAIGITAHDRDKRWKMEAYLAMAVKERRAASFAPR